MQQLTEEGRRIVDEMAQPHISYTDPTPNLSTKTGQVHSSLGKAGKRNSTTPSSAVWASGRRVG